MHHLGRLETALWNSCWKTDGTGLLIDNLYLSGIAFIKVLFDKRVLFIHQCFNSSHPIDLHFHYFLHNTRGIVKDSEGTLWMTSLLSIYLSIYLSFQNRNKTRWSSMPLISECHHLLPSRDSLLNSHPHLTHKHQHSHSLDCPWVGKLIL